MSVAQAVLSAVTLAVAAATGVLVWRANTAATVQREQQGMREEWWRRFQWATELAFDEESDRRANLGVLLVRAMLASGLAGSDEQRAASVVLAEVVQRDDNGDENEEGADDQHR